MRTPSNDKVVHSAIGVPVIDKSQSRRFGAAINTLRRFIFQSGFLVTLICGRYVCAETVFDNLDGPTDGGSWGIGWIEDKVTQQFQLGTNNTVNSAELTLRRDGQLDGSLALELYDDDSGIPGALIGTLGTMDPMSIGVGYDSYLFDDPVSNLIPEETYYLVLSRRNTETRRDDSINWRLTSIPGAPDAKEALANAGPDILNWHTIHNFPAGGPPFPVWGMAKIEAIMLDSELLLGDFDESGVLDVADIDILASVVRQELTDPKYDINQDGQVDLDDHSHWIQDDNFAHTYFGDANLDGEFNSNDLIVVFDSGKYETGEMAGWREGDWNADQVFDTGDLTKAFQDGGYEIGPKPTVAAVPEPSSCFLLALGLISIGRLRPRRSR